MDCYNIEPNNCGCKHSVPSECVFYRGENLSCLGITKGDTLTDVIKSLNEIVCNPVAPSGITYVGTANQIVVLGNTISLSPVITNAITNSQSAITTLENCVSSTIKNITSSTLNISTTNLNSCGRTLNIEAPINTIPLSEKSGIIENIVDWEVLPNNTTKSKNLVPYGLKTGDSLIIKGGIRKINTDNSNQSITISDGTNTQVVSAIDITPFDGKNKFIDFEIKLPIQSVSGSTTFTTRVFSIMDVLLSASGGSTEQFEDKAYFGKKLTQIQATTTFNQSSFRIIFNNTTTGVLEYLTMEIKRKI